MTTFIKFKKKDDSDDVLVNIDHISSVERFKPSDKDYCTILLSNGVEVDVSSPFNYINSIFSNME